MNFNFSVGLISKHSCEINLALGSCRQNIDLRLGILRCYFGRFPYLNCKYLKSYLITCLLMIAGVKGEFQLRRYSGAHQSRLNYRFFYKNLPNTHFTLISSAKHIFSDVFVTSHVNILVKSANTIRMSMWAIFL